MRIRFTLWVAAALLISAAVTFVVVYRDTGHEMQTQIDRDLRGDETQLAQALAGRSPAQTAAAARRYVAAQPYSATSTLLFISVPGKATVSNHPELFGLSTFEPGETASEQAAENAMARALLRPRPGFSVQRLPDVGRVRLLERTLPAGLGRALIGAGEPLALVERSQHSVAKAFLLAGAIVLVLALIASYLAGARVSAPLRRMAGVAARVDAGDLEPRMPLPGGRRDEVRILAEAFNHMLDRLADAFAAQKEFVADASHELRTPLTVIRGQVEVLAAQPHPSEAEVRRVERLVQAEIGRISRLVDELLLLAQAEREDFLRVQQIPLAPFVRELWDGITATAERRFELGPVPEGSLLADPDRLAQVLRNLVRNAIDHTREGDGVVRLSVGVLAPDRVRFEVCDDGPGVPAAERERIFERFHRTDAGRDRRSGGAGLGLAIVRAIAEAHGGEVRVGPAPDRRGACFELLVPGFAGPGSPAPIVGADAGVAGRN
jgi:two-component system, OmpR family, sensor kinase